MCIRDRPTHPVWVGIPLRRSTSPVGRSTRPTNRPCCTRTCGTRSGTACCLCLTAAGGLTRRVLGRGHLPCDRVSTRGECRGGTLVGERGRDHHAGKSRSRCEPVSYTHLRAHETVLDL